MHTPHIHHTDPFATWPYFYHLPVYETVFFNVFFFNLSNPLLVLCVFAECKSENSYCRKGHDKRRNSMRNDPDEQPSSQSLQQQQQHSAGSGNHGYTNLVNDRYASDERMCQSSSIGCSGRHYPNSLTENSPASYTTSLSTDTLYWDDDPMAAGPVHGTASRQHSIKSQSSSQYRRENCSSNAAVKPVKSWDNLTTKAFGGYGFGYEYLDRDQIIGNGGGGGGGGQHMVYLQLKNVKGGGKHHHHHHHHNNHGHHQNSNNNNNGNHNRHHHHHHHNGRIRHPTKSTEALLSLPPQYPIAAVESSSASCEYLDACSSSGSGYFGYVKNDKASQTDYRRYGAAAQQQQHQAEVTRL